MYKEVNSKMNGIKVILMVLNTKKGYYEIIKNHKSAFDLPKFEECYIEECFDKYSYVVGDLSDGLLRLKGFSDDGKADNYIGTLEKYLMFSCSFMCPYYVLKRINKAKYEKLYQENQTMPEDHEDSIPAQEKVPFDKESLVLELTPKTRPRIRLDVQKQNKIKLGVLPANLKDSSSKDTISSNANHSQKEVKEVTYYSSSSEGFELPKMSETLGNNRNHSYKNKNKTKNNQKNPNQQNHKNPNQKNKNQTPKNNAVDTKNIENRNHKKNNNKPQNTNGKK